MKPIATVLAVASMFVTPVVLAQPTPVPPRDVSTVRTPSNGNSGTVLGSFQGSYSTDPRSGTWSPVQGSFRGSYSTDPRTGPWSNVETSFADTDTAAPGAR